MAPVRRVKVKRKNLTRNSRDKRLARKKSKEEIAKYFNDRYEKAKARGFKEWQKKRLPTKAAIAKNLKSQEEGVVALVSEHVDKFKEALKEISPTGNTAEIQSILGPRMAALFVKAQSIIPPTRLEKSLLTGMLARYGDCWGQAAMLEVARVMAIRKRDKEFPNATQHLTSEEHKTIGQYEVLLPMFCPKVEAVLHFYRRLLVGSKDKSAFNVMEKCDIDFQPIEVEGEFQVGKRIRSVRRADLRCEWFYGVCRELKLIFQGYPKEEPEDVVDEPMDTAEAEATAADVVQPESKEDEFIEEEFAVVEDDEGQLVLQLLSADEKQKLLQSNYVFVQEDDMGVYRRSDRPEEITLEDDEELTDLDDDEITEIDPLTGEPVYSPSIVVLDYNVPSQSPSVDDFSDEDEDFSDDIRSRSVMGYETPDVKPELTQFRSKSAMATVSFDIGNPPSPSTAARHRPEEGSQLEASTSACSIVQQATGGAQSTASTVELQAQLSPSITQPPPTQSPPPQPHPPMEFSPLKPSPPPQSHPPMEFSPLKPSAITSEVPAQSDLGIVAQSTAGTSSSDIASEVPAAQSGPGIIEQSTAGTGSETIPEPKLKKSKKKKNKRNTDEAKEKKKKKKEKSLITEKLKNTEKAEDKTVQQTSEEKSEEKSAETVGVESLTESASCLVTEAVVTEAKQVGMSDSADKVDSCPPSQELATQAEPVPEPEQDSTPDSNPSEVAATVSDDKSEMAKPTPKTEPVEPESLGGFIKTEFKVLPSDEDLVTPTLGFVPTTVCSAVRRSSISIPEEELRRRESNEEFDLDKRESVSLGNTSLSLASLTDSTAPIKVESKGMKEELQLLPTVKVKVERVECTSSTITIKSENIAVDDEAMSSGGAPVAAQVQARAVNEETPGVARIGSPETGPPAPNPGMPPLPEHVTNPLWLDPDPIFHNGQLNKLTHRYLVPLLQSFIGMPNHDSIPEVLRPNLQLLAEHLNSATVHLPPADAIVLKQETTRTRKSFSRNFCRMNKEIMEVYFGLIEAEKADPKDGSFYYEGPESANYFNKPVPVELGPLPWRRSFPAMKGLSTKIKPNGQITYPPFLGKDDISAQDVDSFVFEMRMHNPTPYKVIHLKDDIVVRIEDHKLLEELIPPYVELYKKAKEDALKQAKLEETKKGKKTGQKPNKPLDEARNNIVRVGIRMIWPSNSHQAYNDPRSLKGNIDEGQPGITKFTKTLKFHSRRLKVLKEYLQKMFHRVLGPEGEDVYDENVWNEYINNQLGTRLRAYEWPRFATQLPYPPNFYEGYFVRGTTVKNSSLPVSKPIIGNFREPKFFSPPKGNEWWKATDGSDTDDEHDTFPESEKVRTKAIRRPSTPPVSKEEKRSPPPPRALKKQPKTKERSSSPLPRASKKQPKPKEQSSSSSENDDSEDDEAPLTSEQIRTMKLLLAKAEKTVGRSSKTSKSRESGGDEPSSSRAADKRGKSSKKRKRESNSDAESEREAHKKGKKRKDSDDGKRQQKRRPSKKGSKTHDSSDDGSEYEQESEDEEEEESPKPPPKRSTRGQKKKKASEDEEESPKPPPKRATRDKKNK